jgi:ATP-dependent RNA helicase RhlB
MNFTELNLESSLLQGIVDRGYTQMTSVQEKTLAQTLRGRDVTVQSQTGTGKTAAFLITLFDRMLKDTAAKRKKALIITPTRELAVQIEKEARLLNRHLNFSIVSLYGGVRYEGQLTALKKGTDIIIGTPGRLLDFCRKGQLNLKQVGILVIDEADRLLDMGFLPDIKMLLQNMLPRSSRQNMMFSATLNRISQRIASEHMNHPVSIDINPEQLTVDTVSQELYHVYSHIKLNLMLGLLKAQSPKNALIFTNMRHTASKLSRKLQHNGLYSQHLTGDLPQNQRLKIIEGFKAGKFPLLVATDVAARGLQIDNLDMVINYDLPQDCENYVHRIGRTARAGNTGKAITLASEGTARQLDAIESFIGMKIPALDANIDLFTRDKSVGMDQGQSHRKNGSPNRKTDSQVRHNRNFRSRGRQRQIEA